jgi:hypothetical protein
MKKVLVYIFVVLIFVGTPWLALWGTLNTSALNNKDKSVLIVKGVLSGDAEERSEEEDTHETTETEEEDEGSYKLLSELGSYYLPRQLSLIIHHQADLFKEHHREIVTPPPKV